MCSAFAFERIYRSVKMENPENDLIKDVLASMGWHNSFFPVGNDENKKLFKGLEHLGKAKLDGISALETQDTEVSRVSVLLTAASNEFDQNLKLLTAHKSQFSTEHHLYKLAEHDESKFKAILKDTEKTEKELTAQHESLKSNFHFLSFKLGRVRK